MEICWLQKRHVSMSAVDCFRLGNFSIIAVMPFQEKKFNLEQHEWVFLRWNLIKITKICIVSQRAPCNNHFVKVPATEILKMMNGLSVSFRRAMEQCDREHIYSWGRTYCSCIVFRLRKNLWCLQNFDGVEGRGEEMFIAMKVHTIFFRMRFDSAYVSIPSLLMCVCTFSRAS